MPVAGHCCNTATLSPFPFTIVMKRELDDDGSDDEEPQPGKQILPVANLPESFEGEPEDGLQYLFTVR